MKKTYVTLVHSAPRLLKMLPVLLCLLFLSSSSLVAQNYLSLEEAVNAVADARQEVIDNTTAVATSSQSDMEDNYKVRVYMDFILEAKESNSVEGAYDTLMERMYPSKQPGQRKDALLNVFDDLQDLITD